MSTGHRKPNGSEQEIRAGKVSVRRRTATNVAWNYLGHACDLVIAFLLVGYVVRHVAMAEYGLFLLAFSVSGFMLLIDLGVPSGLLIGLAGVRAKGKRDLSAMLSTAFYFSFALGGLALLACLALASWMPGPFNIPSKLLPLGRALFVWAGVLALLALPTRILEIAHQSVHRFDLLTRNQLWLSCLRALATIGALAMGHGVLALMVIQVGIAGLRLVAIWGSLRLAEPEVRLSVRQWNWALFQPVWRTSRWAALDNFSRQLGIGNDSLVLGIFGSMPVMAVYGVGSKLPSQLPALMDRGVIATGPLFCEYGQLDDRAPLRDTYRAVTGIGLLLALPAAMVLFALAGTIIRLWVGPGYAGAAAVMRWLLVAVPALAIVRPAEEVLYATGGVRSSARITMVEAIANISLSLALVFRYGAAGVAAASAITHVAVTLFWYVPTACRAVGMSGWRLFADVTRAFALPLASAIAVLGLLFFVPESMTITRLAVGALSLAAYGATWLASRKTPGSTLQSTGNLLADALWK
jgi:O-antigen/teichoic acid export membrane protein